MTFGSSFAQVTRSLRNQYSVDSLAVCTPFVPRSYPHCDSEQINILVHPLLCVNILLKDIRSHPGYRAGDTSLEQIESRSEKAFISRLQNPIPGDVLLLARISDIQLLST